MCENASTQAEAAAPLGVQTGGPDLLTAARVCCFVVLAPQAVEGFFVNC